MVTRIPGNSVPHDHSDHPVNSLLHVADLPDFQAINPGDFTVAVDVLIAEYEAAVERLLADPRPTTWDAFSELGDVSDRFDRACGVIYHLSAVVNSPRLRAAIKENEAKIARFSSRMSRDERLYARAKSLLTAPDYGTYSPARRKAIDNWLRGFVLSGAELPEDKQNRLSAVHEQLATLGTRFSDNVLDAKQKAAFYVEDAASLRGVPEDLLAEAKEDAEADGRPGWKIGMDIAGDVLRFADDRGLREKLYLAMQAQASDLDGGEHDNRPVIHEILKARREEADLLGFPSYADLAFDDRMVESPQQVIAFLRDLAAKARPQAEADLAELRAFAREELGLTRLEPWDYDYVSEKLFVARYAFSDQEVKRYFQYERVLDGLFRTAESLYGIRVTPGEADAWHKDVRFFNVADADGEAVGHFFIDPYYRNHKESGAWMSGAVDRYRDGQELTLPVGYLVCDLPRPVGRKPALLTHGDVITLFHEFGHALHHLLTRVDESDVAGMNGVEWDAVELPSQFMENFAWEWEVLRDMSAHVATGEALPRALYDKMVAARNFQGGWDVLGEVEDALFDLRLHFDHDPDAPLRTLLEEVRRETALTPLSEHNRFPNTFSHIFSDGYAAGYYSYIWAEVLSADAYAAFEEAARGRPGRGTLDPEMGARFRREILEVGGVRSALESFKAFRGREPSVDALLRHRGIAA